MTSPSSDTLTFAQALADRAHAQPHGELVRVVGQRPWTAAELWRRAAAWAAALDDVRPGSTVATAGDAGPDAIALSAAVSALGAVEIPLAPDIPAQQAHDLLATTEAIAMLATSRRADSQPLLRDLSQRMRIPLLRADADLPDEPSSATHLIPRAMPPSAPALVMTTSGTTGRAKAALLPVGAPIGQARRVATAMAYTADDTLLSFFPWHHINARHASFMPAVLSGARLVVAPHFSASRFLETVRSEGITAFNFMGAVCMMLLAQPPTTHDRDHDIRAAYGGPAPATMVADFQDRFGITLRQAYACTELGDVSVTGGTELRPGAAGRPVDDYDVRVVDDAGIPVPGGQVGELQVRPGRPGLAFLHYVGDSDATRAAWSDGWFRTRDRVRLVDGWLHVEGRLGDVIRRRGNNIDPQHVEEVLLAHPDVVEAAAVAVPSDLTEDEVLAAVVPAQGSEISPKALCEHCRHGLPRHAVPRYISIEKALPHNGSLKVDRAALRERGLPTGAWDADDHTPTPTESR